VAFAPAHVARGEAGVVHDHRHVDGRVQVAIDQNDAVGAGFEQPRRIPYATWSEIASD